MVYILFLITITVTGGHNLERIGEFKTLNDCFDKRENIVYKRGRPIVDYQLVCITNTTKMTANDKKTFLAGVEERKKYEW